MYFGRLVFIVFFVLLCSCKIEAQQSYRSLVDSCCWLLEKQDTASFQKVYPELYEAFLMENDPYYEVSKELEFVRKKDQSLRLLYMDVQKTYGSSDSLTQVIRACMDELDEKNAAYAKIVLQKYGWLTTDEVSEGANEGLFLIVQHCEDVEVQKMCLSLLEKKLKDYPDERWHYAFLTDRFAMNQGKNQTYGTQKIVRKGVPFPVPLMFPEKVDSLRKEMGLASLWKELDEEYGGGWSLEKYLSEEKQIKEVFQEYVEKKR